MDVKDWFKQVAYLKFIALDGCDVPKSWLSKFDNSYITFEGLEKDMKFLADREITKQLTHGVGFSPKDNKWYGWSHRAIFGFEIGSTCKKGDCHYRSRDKKDFLEQMLSFWSDAKHLNIKGRHDKEEIIYSIPIDPGEAEQKSLPSGKFQEGVYISWTYDNTIPNERLRNRLSGCFQPYPDQWGKGEWVAKTMKDAKQMAIDFSRGVS